MPELPEVETIRRTLLPHLKGKEIVGVEVYLTKAVRPDPDTFKKMLIGRKITTLTRRGKFLIFSLDSGEKMAFHLRMTGRLLYFPSPSPMPRHTTLVLKLKDGGELQMEDYRKFGTVHLFAHEPPPGLARLGPEPWDGQALERLQTVGKRRKGPVKALLLDQTVLAGLGNIYTDEALFAAGIDPARPANTLSPEDWEKLHTAVCHVLEEGLAHQGTSRRDYVDGQGRPGTHQDYLQVYGRKAQPCFRCGGPLNYCRVAGRGTHYCPNCQR